MSRERNSTRMMSNLVAENLIHAIIQQVYSIDTL